MNKSTKHKGGCSCCNISIRIQSVELLEDFSNIPNELKSRFKEPCFVTCKMGGYFVKNKNLIKKTKFGEWAIFECLNCNSSPFAYHSENRNLYLVDLINLKQTKTNKIIEEPDYFDQQTTKNLDEIEQIYIAKNIDRTRTKKKRRRRRKHKRKSKNKNDYQNKIKIKSTKQIGFNNMPNPFLENTKTTEIPQEFNNNETLEFNNYSFMTDPFFQFRKEEEEKNFKNNNKKKNKKKNKNDRKESQRFSEIFRKVSVYEQNHSPLFDEDNQFYSDDQQENWEIFQQESKSIPIPISNSLSTDLQTDSSVDSTENPNNSPFIQPHKFLETSQSPTERGLEHAFNVPLKRLPTWRIQNNCLDVFGNLNFEN
ncbi:akt1 substrate 1 protein [Anaeramoeba flamelloides]|uniref:Akt1 substrate 1 protein n=1 Tax=Anaeramoeba flamelloides TaxID=1746091 RepID=A0ABQ8YFI8_9EUKA|nr:akt1 substrate 1 protein [Anaeramoeba flamelloides]